MCVHLFVNFKVNELLISQFVVSEGHLILQHTALYYLV
jgi:hypothetical protein